MSHTSDSIGRPSGEQCFRDWLLTDRGRAAVESVCRDRDPDGDEYALPLLAAFEAGWRAYHETRHSPEREAVVEELRQAGETIANVIRGTALACPSLPHGHPFFISLERWEAALKRLDELDPKGGTKS